MNKFPQFSQTGPRQQLTQTPYSFCKQPQLISKTLNIGVTHHTCKKAI